MTPIKEVVAGLTPFLHLPYIYDMVGKYFLQHAINGEELYDHCRRPAVIDSWALALMAWIRDYFHPGNLIPQITCKKYINKIKNTKSPFPPITNDYYSKQKNVKKYNHITMSITTQAIKRVCCYLNTVKKEKKNNNARTAFFCLSCLPKYGK